MDRGGGPQGLLGNESFLEQAGLTEADVERVQAKAQQISERLQDDIRKLREQAQEEAFSVLTPEQRAKIKQIVGDPFEFKNPRRNRRRGGDRGRGPGGPRGPGGKNPESDPAD